jgi:hypothetical protein
MQNINYKNRIILLKELLSEYQSLYLQISETTSDIKKASCSIYEETMQEYNSEILTEIEKYRKNIERMKAVYFESTAKINAWYEFTKNIKELERLSYPIKYHLKKKSLYKSMKKMNEELSNIVIENRFIKEQLTILEHKLEIKAMEKIKSDDCYINYENMIQKMDSLMAELKYIIPSIPGLCPVDISISEINTLPAKFYV